MPGARLGYTLLCDCCFRVIRKHNVKERVYKLNVEIQGKNTEP